MTTIRIENNYSYLHAPDDVKQILWSNMRFRARGAWFNPRVQARLWDGFTEFFKKGTGRFLTGLLPEVKHALQKLKHAYTVIDTRTPVEFETQQITPCFLGDNVELRDYQVDYVNKCISGQRGIIPSPVSSGKTMMLVSLVKAMKKKTPTLILANRTDLIEQNYDELVKFGVQNVGRFYGKRKEPNWITCSTVQSAHLLAPIFPKVRALFVDEIHDMMTKQSKEVYAKLTNCYLRVAMSATAYKFGGSDSVQKFEVKGWIGPLLRTKCTKSGMLTMKELQHRDILSRANCQCLTIEKPQLPYEIYQDAVTRGIAENDYFHDVVKRIADKCPGRTLIMVERIEHGDRLADKIPGSIWVKGADDGETRKAIIERLKMSRDKCVAIATRGIFNTGINVFIHNLINAAGGQADHQIIQLFGRGLRRAEDKSLLHYYDFIFAINDYLRKHSDKRVKILEKEGHAVVVYDHDDVEQLQFLSDGDCVMNL